MRRSSPRQTQCVRIRANSSWVKALRSFREELNTRCFRAMISLLHPGAEQRICIRKCSPHFFLFAIEIALIVPSRSFVPVPGAACSQAKISWSIDALKTPKVRASSTKHLRLCSSLGCHIADAAAASANESRIFSLATLNLERIPEDQLIIRHASPAGLRRQPCIPRT